MIIRMLQTMSSGRHDGRVWAPPGVDFEVPDWEGDDLVGGGLAVKVTGPAKKQKQEEAEAVANPDQVWPPYEPSRFAQSAPPPEPEPEPEAEAEVPKPAAPKSDWVAWAVRQGVPYDEANLQTKQQLMEQYGQRP